VAASIKLLVGLGNPGPQYEATRHNAGEWFLRWLLKTYEGTLRVESRFHGLATRIQINGEFLHLLVPTTFMNHSGQSLQAFSQFYKIAPEEILIAHDELDLPCGQLKLKFDGGHGGHNGLRDIVRHLNTQAFYRLRIGIGHPGHRDKVLNYVLNPPNGHDKKMIEDSFERFLPLLPQLLQGHVQEAMKELHTLESPPS